VCVCEREWTNSIVFQQFQSKQNKKKTAITTFL
jgi:hypothetical protein